MNFNVMDGQIDFFHYNYVNYKQLRMIYQIMNITFDKSQQLFTSLYDF